MLPLLSCPAASGKTTVCDRIVQRLHDQCVVMLNQDSFYRSLTEVGGGGGRAVDGVHVSMPHAALADKLSAGTMTLQLLRGIRHLLCAFVV
jgi:cytidylate kinase